MQNIPTEIQDYMMGAISRAKQVDFEFLVKYKLHFY